MPVMTFLRHVSLSLVSIAAGEILPSRQISNAIIPATNGVAIEVPEMLLVACIKQGRFNKRKKC